MDFLRVLVIAWALYCGVTFVRSAISAPSREGEGSERSPIQRADADRERKDANARYAGAIIALCMAGALAAHVVSLVIAYAVLCLVFAGRSAADQIAEERAPRRRSALIGRSRMMDPILVTWMVLAGLASLVLIPWFQSDAYRVATGVVALCVLVMLGIAWRIASAPPLLLGSDIEAEEAVDRETRAIRTGNACFSALAAVFFFMAFVGEPAPFALAVVLLFFGLVAWKSLYVRHLSRTPLVS